VSPVNAGGFDVGGASALLLIAGPDVVESEEMVLRTCETLREMTAALSVPFIFKCSYQKANRSSGASYAGPGVQEGLEVLSKVKQEFGVPVTTDVHETGDVAAVADVVDLIQIPAFLCRQTPLAIEVARAGKPVNIKKGQFVAPSAMHALVKKITDEGNPDVMVTERGTSFGYNNLVVDMRGLAEMSRLGTPVIFDMAHSTQLPAAVGDRSGGERKYAALLARAAVAAGVAGVFCEVHPDPPAALCDADSQVTPAQMEAVLKQLLAIDAARRTETGNEARALPTPGEEL
jgi:2-dehydro-3-deoxyphosphooctonate aldolase (KDO 8-P synthase)